MFANYHSDKILKENATYICIYIVDDQLSHLILIVTATHNNNFYLESSELFDLAFHSYHHYIKKLDD